MGKVIAQRAFSDAAEQSGEWDAITCCPADNVGPVLSPHQKNMGPWQHRIETMLLGEYEQTSVYRPWMLVDVRDDAECHIRLLESVQVQNGERYIAWSTETRNVEDIAARIDQLLPEIGHAPPTLIDNHPERHQAAKPSSAASGPSPTCATIASARSPASNSAPSTSPSATVWSRSSRSRGSSPTVARASSLSTDLRARHSELSPPIQ